MHNNEDNFEAISNRGDCAKVLTEQPILDSFTSLLIESGGHVHCIFYTSSRQPSEVKHRVCQKVKTQLK